MSPITSSMEKRIKKDLDKRKEASEQEGLKIELQIKMKETKMLKRYQTESKAKFEEFQANEKELFELSVQTMEKMLSILSCADVTFKNCYKFYFSKFNHKSVKHWDDSLKTIQKLVTEESQIDQQIETACNDQDQKRT